MPIVTLSHDFVSKAVCPESKKKINYYHKDIRGFLLEVRSSGGKTYALRYRDKHNRQCQYKIGDSKDISFEKARRAAEKARGKVVLGQDPNGDKVGLQLLGRFLQGPLSLLCQTSLSREYKCILWRMCHNLLRQLGNYLDTS